MPQIRGFPAIRYREGTDLSLVTAPPYDVITPAERERLANLHENNIVHLTLGEQFPTDTDEDSRYTRAASTFQDWLSSGALVTDDAENLFLYRLDFLGSDALDASGASDASAGEKSIAGLVGALTLEELGSGGVFGHERTIAGPKADRLNLWRSTQANFEPLWFFASETLSGFKDLVEGLAQTPPIAETTDPEGIRHRIWIIPATQAEAIQAEVERVPLVVADGHHRYETSVTYRDERRAVDGPGPWDATLAMITDPVEYAPAVEPIHRIVEGLAVSELPDPEEFDGDLGALSRHVEQSGAGTIGVARAEGLWTIKSAGEIDTVWLAETILEPAKATVRYDHHLHILADEVNKLGVTVFVMPATPVALVAKKALEGARLPPKTTLFTPKPRSGLLMRSLKA